MLVARQKRKENIVEYILYMYQIEDLIRALNFDLELIEKKLISQYQEDYQTRREIREWYKSILSMLKENQLEKKGHIPLLNGLSNSLNDTHLFLLEGNNVEYKDIYQKTKPLVDELRNKTGDADLHDMNVCLNGLYGLLILKIQKKELNPETEKAFENISQLMNVVSRKFHESERGETEL